MSSKDDDRASRSGDASSAEKLVVAEEVTLKATTKVVAADDGKSQRIKLKAENNDLDVSVSISEETAAEWCEAIQQVLAFK